MLFPGLKIFWEFLWVCRSNWDLSLEHPSFPIFYPFLHLVYYPTPPPHVPSFLMHQTAIINSAGTHYSFNLKSLSPLFFWLTPTFPSKVSLNITSRKPSLTYQPISLPAPLPPLHFGQTCTMPPGHLVYLSVPYHSIKSMRAETLLGIYFPASVRWPAHNTCSTQLCEMNVLNHFHSLALNQYWLKTFNQSTSWLPYHHSPFPATFIFVVSWDRQYCHVQWSLALWNADCTALQNSSYCQIRGLDTHKMIKL